MRRDLLDELVAPQPPEDAPAALAQHPQPAVPVEVEFDDGVAAVSIVSFVSHGSGPG